MFIDKILKILGKSHDAAILVRQEELPDDLRSLIEKEQCAVNSYVNISEQANRTELQKTHEESVFQNSKSDNPIYRETQRSDNITIADSFLVEDTIEELVERVRPEQALIFQAVHYIISSSKHLSVQQAVYYSVDVPLEEKDKRLYQWIRCYVHLQDQTIAIAPLGNEKPYDGQPFFPRLIAENANVSIIPNEVRAKIYAQFLQIKGLKKCPLNDRPKLMLRISYTLNDKSYSELRIRIEKCDSLAKEGFRPSEETIKSHFKKCADVAEDLFGVHFNPRRSVAPYWAEMGFDVMPIPDLGK